MKSRIVGSVILLAGISLLLGSCLNEAGVTPYQQMQIDVKKIDAYLAANPPAEDDILIRDASGVRMVITEMGTDDLPPTPENIVQVAYTGRLLSNGKQFETSDSYTFTITKADVGPDIIAGWKIALGMMTEGTHATVYIPSGLAYGTGGSGAIPDNAVLVFDLELKVVNTSNERPKLNQDSTAIAIYAEDLIEDIQADPGDRGLHYVVNAEGTGDTPGLYDHVTIRYTGKVFGLTEQKVFAENITQGPSDIFSSRLVNYVHGLTLGLQKMKKGGKTTFYIPSPLAYGPTSNEVIPANSILIFEIELLEVTPNQE